ncbi:MAG: DUF4401 domain-containing protein [Roseiflexaceae bacterium]
MTTMQTVLEQLVDEGWLAPDARATIVSALSAPDDAAGTPWYVRALVGISAWIAAVLLTAFLVGGTQLVNSAEASIVAGLILCAVAIAMRRTLSRSIFAAQLALALSMAGQALFTFGVADFSNGVLAIVVGLVVLEVALIAIYPDMLHRFLSTVVIVGALVALLLDWNLPGLVHLLVGLLAAGALVLWERESTLVVAQFEGWSRPIGYGLIVALLGVLCLGLTDLIAIPYWWISGLLLLPMLLVLEYRVVSRFEPRANAAIAPWLVGATVLVSLPALWTPGVLAAVIAIVLGFQRGNRLLLGIGAFFLVVFLIAFYYHLDVTLLLKSLLLLATGLLLLGLRALMPREPSV